MRSVLKSLDYHMVLQDFTYKPNFTFSTYERDGRDMIKITMTVEDSREPCSPWVVQPSPRREVRRNFGNDWYDTVTQVWGNYTIPYMPEGEEHLFIEWVRTCIIKMEEHEVDEWVRYKGELVNDPHAKD